MGRIVATLWIGLGVSIFAADAVTGAVGRESVDAQIEAIRNADPRMRRELMNAFKRRLAEMNRKERMEAISRLRKKMGDMRAKRGEGASGNVKEPMRGMKNAVQTQRFLQMERAGGAERVIQGPGAGRWSSPPGGPVGGTGAQGPREGHGGGAPLGH